MPGVRSYSNFLDRVLIVAGLREAQTRASTESQEMRLSPDLTNSGSRCEKMSNGDIALSQRERALPALEHGPKIPHVLDTFEIENRIDQLGRSVRTEHRVHQITSFGDHFFAAHWIVERSSNRRDVFVNPRAVVHDKLDSAFAARHPPFEFFVGDELYFRAMAENCSILHAGRIVSRAERDGFIDEHHSDKVLQANIGDLAVVDDRGFVGCDLHENLR